MPETSARFTRFVEIIAALRHPKTGCPWDLEQTHESIRPYLIEEAYEVLEAIEQRNDAELTKELGDLLLQVVLHAQIAKDRGAFGIDEILEKISEKMIRRHPHVFGTEHVSGPEEVLQNWEKIKYQERKEENQNTSQEKKTSMLSGVPAAMPALLRAQRLGEKATKVSFDWTTLSGVWDKVKEETSELEAEIHTSLNREGPAPLRDIAPKELAAAAHEIGDVLFSICQIARWLNLSAEDCLRFSCDRFVQRFAAMEQDAGRALHELTLDELEAAWQKAKQTVAAENKG